MPKSNPKSNSSALVKTAVKVSKVKKTEKKDAVTSRAAIAKVKSAKKTVRVQVIDTKGKDAGDMQLPKVMFAAPINNVLIAQAVRVYLANQRRGTVSTKTRGEVEASTRKIWRQKGTGRARHGAVSAPIFVGGGIAFGPKPRDHSLQLSKKMRQKALFSALSARMHEKAVAVVSGMEKLTPKTKEAAGVFAALPGQDKKQSILLITAKESENVVKAARNLPFVSLLPYSQINTYEVMRAKTVVIMKDAALQMVEHFMKGDN